MTLKGGFVKALLNQLARFWKKAEAPILLIGATSGLLVWAYSNFATASSMIESKTELRQYVDQRHGEVKGDLEDIKKELAKQRNLQEQILLRVR